MTTTSSSGALLSGFALSFLFATASVAADQAAPIAPASAKARYEHLRRISVQVKADLALVGKLVSVHVKDAAGSELGTGRFTAAGAATAALVMLPMPPIGQPYGALVGVVDGVVITSIELPNADSERHRAFSEEPIVFHPGVFAGEKLPLCDFKEPNLVEDAVGAYTLTTTYYDEAYQPVTIASKKGRYGAVVEATAADGQRTRRFVTLFRQDELVALWRADFKTSMELPAGLGVDPAVSREQPGALDQFMRQRFGSALDDGAPLAPLLACLHEVKPGAGRLPERLGPSATDARWWFPLKKKLGFAAHRYLTFLPKDYDAQPTTRFPLLLFLHGSGERGNDINEVRVHGPHKHLSAHDNPFVIIEPQCNPGEWWCPSALIDLLDEVRAKYRLDDQRLYLTGLSMGGFGSWATAIEFPDRFAAVVPICGRGDPDEAARIEHLPIWVFHGAKDPAVPLKFSEEMVEALTRLGHPPKFTVYPQAQHDSWTQAYDTPELYTWLLAQHRSADAPPPTPINR